MNTKLILYHGSPNLFDTFDFKKIRTNGTSEGVGFYFTENKKIAEVYGQNGYLYTVDFQGEKPLSDKEKTLTKEELKKIIVELDETGDFLSNYGDVDYEGYETVLESALNGEYDYAETDTEILGSLYNAMGEDEDVIHVFCEKFGYDHIVSTPDWGNQRLFIALTNDIFSIVRTDKLTTS